jgi:hypothetical protein
MSLYLNASTLAAGNTHMAASMNIVANTDGKKTDINHLIELKAELARVKADLMDELDKVNADAEKLRDRRDSFAAIKETPTIGKFRAKT